MIRGQVSELIEEMIRSVKFVMSGTAIAEIPIRVLLDAVVAERAASSGTRRPSMHVIRQTANGPTGSFRSAVIRLKPTGKAMRRARMQRRSK
jgi:hypothetical protein